jgi:hypothetical protein
MKIFFLSVIPRECAQMHVDKHLYKKIFEYYELICDKNKHHPCSSWVKKSNENYKWLVELTLELCYEYKYRYNKIHKYQQLIIKLKNKNPKVPLATFTEPTQIMPEMYKGTDFILAYRDYYFFEKHSILQWTKRPTPFWIQVMYNVFEKDKFIISENFQYENIESFCKKNTITNEKAKTRNEVQSHGFSWEQELITNVYGTTEEELKKNVKYNSKIDLPSTLNNLDRCDLSIKTSSNVNTVCMADCLRVYDEVNSGKNIHLVVVFYEQNDTRNTKNISSIIELDLTNSCELLFGIITRSQLEELDKAVKSVPQKRKPTVEEHTIMYSLRNRLQENSGAIYFNIKCNSTQSRLQCSFNKFQQFVQKNPSRVIAKSNTNEFRGGVISGEINSSRRVFKKNI